MKLCVVVPSADYLKQAGVRIRYERIAPALEELGHSLSLELIDNFRASSRLEHDIYLFSKCTDAKAPLLARAINGAGRLVGVDLFDDYFSQSTDARFLTHREWLRTITPLVDFILCSTQRMKEVAQSYTNKPIHVMNDPLDKFDANAAAKAVAAKIDHCHSHSTIDLLWFGMGDNPYFQVGLDDLHAYGATLSELVDSRWKINFTVLTNRRALTAAGLERLARLPIQPRVHEWSTTSEAEHLSRATVAFIPVNAQNFSICKSMNRAVTALASGTQIISPGYPLYSTLDRFVYRNGYDFLDDLDARHFRSGQSTLNELNHALTEYASARSEAEGLARWLVRLQATPKAVTEKAPFAVLHGVRTSADCHKLAQRLGGLSIASPFTTAALNFDVCFNTLPEHNNCVLLSDKALLLLSPDTARNSSRVVTTLGRSVTKLDIQTLYPAEVETICQSLLSSGRAAHLIHYQRSMAAALTILKGLFPCLQVVLSEKESPFHISANTPTRAA